MSIAVAMPFRALNRIDLKHVKPDKFHVPFKTGKQECLALDDKN